MAAVLALEDDVGLTLVDDGFLLEQEHDRDWKSRKVSWPPNYGARRASLPDSFGHGAMLNDAHVRIPDRKSLRRRALERHLRHCHELLPQRRHADGPRL